MSPAFRGAIALALLALAAGTQPGFAQSKDYSTPIVRPFYTNVANFSTTTTTASPTFTRPAINLGGVTNAPLGPSGIGTSVGYAVQSYTAADSNQYRVTNTISSGYAVTASSSNLVQVLYTGAFDPTDKTFANAQLAYNPGGATGSYTTNLDAGQAYTFVNGGRYNSTQTGAQNSLGSVTTNIDEYNAGSTQAIPQADTLQNPGVVSQTLTLSGGGPVTSFNSIFIAGLNQTYLGGLTATLTHNGVSVNLFNQTGANPSNYNQGSSANFSGDYYFSDSGLDLAAAAAAQEPPIGSFADPGTVAGGQTNTYKSLGSLSAFQGLSLSGDWTLSLKDSDQGDDGSFLGFSFNAGSPNPAAVPEASTWVSTGLGCFVLGLMAVKRRRAAARS